MSTFLLIRHASIDAAGKWLAGRQPGTLLNRSGEMDAERLAVRLRPIPIAAVYSSPMERAQQTCAPLCRDRSLNVNVRDEFNEIDFGDWTGKTFEELDSLGDWKLFNQFRSRASTPDGETMLGVTERFMAGLECLHKIHGDDSVAIFSHGDPIRAAVAHYMGLHLDFIHRLAIDPASVTVLKLDESGAQVLRVNDTGELGC
jgi:broad specificity phosphatase PhoE